MSGKFRIYGRFAVPILLLVMLHYYIESTPLPSEVYLDFCDITEKKGYQCSTHYVTTEDGYILTMFNIKNKKQPGKPVLMVHGVYATADGFVINVNGKAPAFSLADAGYDVWLPNTRGTFHSQAHKYLDLDSKEFWSWTAIETARYDLPAVVQFVKEFTSQEQVGYIGHSLGGSMMFFVLAVKPELEKDLSIVISLSSTLAKFKSESLLMNLITSDFSIETMDFLGVKQVLEKPTLFMTKFLQAFPNFAYWITWDRYDPLLHGDSVSSLAYYSYKYSGGTSLENLRFLRRVMDSPSYELSHWDFGEQKNLDIYGKPRIGKVEYSNIRAKVALLGGLYDLVVKPGDIERFARLLPQESLVFKKLNYQHDHCSFLFSSDQKYMEDVLSLLKQHFN